MLVSFGLFFFSPQYFSVNGAFNLETANKLGGFIAGVTGIFFAGTGTFLVFLTFEQQREQFKSSQFESSFFHLLSHLQILIEHISGPVRWANIQDGNVKGRKYFYYQIREFKDLLNKKAADALVGDYPKYTSIALHISTQEEAKPESPIDTSLYAEFIEEVYEEFYTSRYSYLGHYFRFVYNLLRFIDDSNLTEIDKNKYTNLIQAQMSSDELGLLLYNSLGRYGKEKLYPLIEKYEFLSNIDSRVLEDAEYIYLLFPNTNFKYKYFKDKRKGN